MYIPIVFQWSVRIGFGTEFGYTLAVTSEVYSDRNPKQNMRVPSYATYCLGCSLASYSDSRRCYIWTEFGGNFGMKF